MRTLVLRGKTQKARQRIQQHGDTWEITEILPDRVRIQSLGKTFHVGGGVMEHDWRFVQIHGDRDYEIVLGRGQLPQPVLSSTVVESVCGHGYWLDQGTGNPPQRLGV